MTPAPGAGAGTSVPPPGRSRSWRWTLLQAAIACAAILYLVSAMNWHDQVVIPAGARLPGLPPAPAQRLAQVVDADGKSLHLVLDGADILLPRAQLGTAVGEVHLKPGIMPVLRGAKVGDLVTVLLVIACVIPVQALRWCLLLRARGIAPSPLQTLRLHLIGCFWNCLFPGLTGGDAVKAWQVARQSGRTADAIMSVLVDRLLDLLALFVLAALAGMTLSESTSHQLLTQRIWLVLAILVPGILVWVSPTISRVIGVDRLITWSLTHPRVALVAAALLAYRRHHAVMLACFACSVAGHLLLIGGCIIAGRTLGIVTPWGEMLMLLSLVFLIGAVPISLFGLGVMEVAAVALMGSLASPNQVISMLVIYRLALIATALPGGLLMIGGTHLRPVVGPVPGAGRP